MNQSTADRSYRWAALPFAIFLLIGGTAFGVAAFTFPAYAIFMPPIATEMAKRAVFLAVAVLVFVTGLGFLKRRVWALYAFVGYVLIGTAWHVVVGLIDPMFRGLLCSPLLNLPIAYAIYKATRPAFAPATEQRPVAPQESA